MDRRNFITAVGCLGAVLPLPAYAQNNREKFQVGFLYPGPHAAASPRLAALASGLQAGGLQSADRFALVPRLTGGDSSLLGPMAQELVAAKVNLIAAIGPAAVRAAQSATSSIPIVANDLESDPVASGFVASVKRPGRNITGVFLDLPDFSKKWLEALREAVPHASEMAVLWDPATGLTQRQAIETAASQLKVKLIIVELKGGRAGIEPALELAAKRQASAIVILSSPLVGGNTKLFADLTIKYRLPAVTMFPDFARDGGLMAYGPNLLGTIRRGGTMAARILQGSNVAEMPVEIPTKFEFVLNLKTASVLGLAMPASTLLRADEVLE